MKKTQRVELKVPKNKETLPDSPINRGYLIYYLIPKLCPFINPIIYLSHPGTEELLPQERSIYLLAPTIPVILGWQLLESQTNTNATEGSPYFSVLVRFVTVKRGSH